MSLNEQIEKEYVEAYKARETVRLSVLRLLKTAVKNRLVEKCAPKGTLDDTEMLDIILKQAKQRQDSIEQYTKAGRHDLAEKENLELEILKKYLPKTLDAEELAAVIEQAVDETGAKGPQDMGRVIGRIMATHKGQVDGKILSEAIRKRLAQK